MNILHLAIPLAILLGVQDEESGVDKVVMPPENPSFEGLIEAYRDINLSASVEGVIETVTVDRGDIVEKGQIVATLESSFEEVTLEIARTRTELEGAVKKQEARLEYSVTKLDNDQKLFDGGIVSDDILKQSQTEQRLAEAGLLEARENLRMANLEEKRADVALKKRVVRSPMDGVVTERFLSPGELVTRQYQSKIVRIARLDTLRVEVILPVEFFGKIDTGMTAEITSDYLPEYRNKTEVKTVDRVVDAASGTFRARLEISNADGRLAPGLKCRVRFLKDEG